MLQGDMIIPSITVGDILALAAAETPDALDPAALLEELQLQQLKSQRLSSLSGGQLRRVTFAVALMVSLICSFLMNRLSAWTPLHAKFWNKIGQLRQQGKTIIITSHYLEEIPTGR